MAIRRLIAMSCGLALLACANSAQQAGSDSAQPPVIDRVVPDRGPAGPAYPLRLTLEGRFFADSANTITFGPVLLNGIASSEGGTRIVFYAPKESPSRGEVPPAPLQPGTYALTVTTGAGVSNTVSFIMTNETGARQ
jgi:hypothetical protein